MPLPERQINDILRKFGPKIIEYLKAIGYFDQEGPYNPVDLTSNRVMNRYLKASKAKNTEVWQVLERYLLPELEGTGEAFIVAYGLNEVIPVRAIATKYIESRGGQLIKRMTETDQKKLVKFIWADSGQNERVMASMVLKQPHLSQIVDNNRVRTKTIIRTEKARATRGGAHEFAKNAGATTATWHTVGDSRVRPSHRALNGVTVKMGGEFADKVSKTTTVYQQFPAQKEVNCRCFLEYGFDAQIADTPHPSMATLEALYS
jgi:hypothetical protein